MDSKNKRRNSERMNEVSVIMNIFLAKISLTMMTGATKHLYPYNSLQFPKFTIGFLLTCFSSEKMENKRDENLSQEYLIHIVIRTILVRTIFVLDSSKKRKRKTGESMELKEKKKKDRMFKIFSSKRGDKIGRYTARVKKNLSDSIRIRSIIIG